MQTPARTPVAVVSHLYPRRQQENYGVFVYEQTRALVGVGAQVTSLVSPVPLAPWPLPALSEKWRRYAAAERRRTDFGSVPVEFPRYPSFPRKALRGYSASRLASAVLNSAELAERFKAARVIVAHTALLDGRAAQIIGRRLGLPYVVFVHGEDLYQNIRGPQAETLAAQVEAVLSGAAAVIGVSEAVAEGLSAAFPALPRAFVLPNGVDTAVFSPKLPPAEAAVPEVAASAGSVPLRLFSAGHLVERKAHAYVLRAMASLVADGKDLTYTIAGDGPQRAHLESLASELGVSDRVTFLGAYFHDDLPSLLHEADLFVLPSWDEAFGVVYLEAMACGLPVVAADDEGAATIVDEGVDGFLVPPRDVDALAEAINEYLDTDGAGRAKMHAAAREKALGYTWEANARRLMDILDDVTA